MVETAIYSQWMHREKLNLKYASWRLGRSTGEVDVVLVDTKFFKPNRCVEVKWSNRYFSIPKELGSLRHFCEQNKLTAALVTTIDKEGVLEVGGIRLTFLPAAVYAYNIGFVRFEATALGAELL